VDENDNPPQNLPMTIQSHNNHQQQNVQFNIIDSLKQNIQQFIIWEYKTVWIFNKWLKCRLQLVEKNVVSNE
jgi:hypothetical protein